MTELVWDGKYKDGKKQGPVRVALPFQTIETVNESAQERQRSLELFASGQEGEWRNRLIWGDKKYVLPSLLPEFTGKVELIYIDPPFDTGADFSFTATIPDYPETPEDETTKFVKEPSILEQKAYRDIWGRGLDSYLQWFSETVPLLRELLAEDGSLFVHLDWHVGHYAKLLLDEVFGYEQLCNEFIWRRANNKRATRRASVVHDTILWYAKTQEYYYNELFHKHRDEYIREKYRYVEGGRRYRLQSMYGKGTGSALRFGDKRIPPPAGLHWRWTQDRIDQAMKQGLIVFPKGGDGMPCFKDFLDTKEGIPLQSIWNDIPDVNSQAHERLGFPTQKPEALLERIIRAASREGHLVLDCFVGSGTTAAVAEKLNRRWISCDLGRFAVHTTRKRLLDIPGIKPFTVQNLGKYERQSWQMAEFPANGRGHAEEQREREAAYRKFILDLYHATLIAGYTWLHGTKGGRMVHVGAIDAPVTLADVKATAKEAWKAVGKGKDALRKAGVDVLGWEFAFEVNELAKNVAAESRVDVTFRKIPREVLDRRAVEQGDVKFFELGALSVDAKQKKREVVLKLTDFVIPTDDIPQEARKSIKHWSQLIDYWAVDWDYKDDTFHNQWQTYRTRKNPRIDLETKKRYSEPGKRTIVVKVIDILGNDTTKTVEVSVK